MVKTSTSKRKTTLEKEVPRKMYAHLLWKDLSKTDLARELYDNKDARAGITKWLTVLEEKELIFSHGLPPLTPTKTYQANLSYFGTYSKEEENYIRILTERFWNPKRTNPIKAYEDILDEIILVKIYFDKYKKFRKYNPSQDLKKFRKERDKFWKDKDFRNNFLDKIKEGTRAESNIRKDFLFMGAIAPKELIKNTHTKLNCIGEPLNFAKIFLEEAPQ